jgi:hypothetical protein
MANSIAKTAKCFKIMAQMYHAARALTARTPPCNMRAKWGLRAV